MTASVLYLERPLSFAGAFSPAIPSLPSLLVSGFPIPSLQAAVHRIVFGYCSRLCSILQAFEFRAW